jgi:putative mRNA 3-end processing factor
MRSVQEPTLLRATPRGLYCEAGDFYVDPRRQVDRAVITHAHADHARPGCRRYLTARPGWRVLRRRLKYCSGIETAEYGETVTFNGVRVSLHPAGHILGSAQVRVEHRGEVWVVSGDYKLEPDPTCAPFEPVPCHTFVSECTFGLPVYRWPAQGEVLAAIEAWWRANREAGRASLLYTYALGKAQRVLAALDGPGDDIYIYAHEAVERVNRDYRESGVNLPRTRSARNAPASTDWSRALVLAPPTVRGSRWPERFGGAATAFASGWMVLRGAAGRHAVDRGFILSDHADWPGLLSAIESTRAERVWLAHGESEVLARELGRRGLEVRDIDGAGEEQEQT